MVWDDVNDVWYSVCYTYVKRGIIVTAIVRHHKVLARTARIYRKLNREVWTMCRDHVIQSL